MSRARCSRNWREMAWIGGCLIFGAVAVLRTQAETVLVAYADGNKEVRQFSVANGVWTYEKVFASGSYEGKAMTPAGVTSDGRRVYIGDIAARRILAFETDGTFVGTVTNFATTCMPDCVCAAPNGYLYMSDAFGSAGDRIYRFDLDTWQGGEFIATTGWGETSITGVLYGFRLWHGACHPQHVDSAGHGRSRTQESGGTVADS